MIAIEDISGPDLVRLFNAATGGDVRRFESKARGVAKLRAELEARGLVIDRREDGTLFVRMDVAKLDPADLAFVQPSAAAPAAPIAEEPKVGRSRKYDHDAVDAAILEILKAIGPCKIGAVRAAYLAQDPELAGLTVKALKGMMRASVRRLEASGAVTKDGMIFAAR